mmetsp:Transcript_2636/g.3829  ORF Transcript_2636/g.3829 Transcript_2636/m.3829 type:complete len:104 (-) Transcript_2636:600-911(-)
MLSKTPPPPPPGTVVIHIRDFESEKHRSQRRNTCFPLHSINIYFGAVIFYMDLTGLDRFCQPKTVEKKDCASASKYGLCHKKKKDKNRCRFMYEWMRTMSFAS